MTDLFNSFENVTICDDADEAYKETQPFNRMAKVVPVHAYTQGNRLFLSTVLTTQELIEVSMLKHPAKGEKRDISADEFLQRKADQAHIDQITGYLVESQTWILGSVTLNASEPLKTFLHGKGPVLPGYVVLPKDMKIAVIDGQHRWRALEAAVKHRDSLVNDSIPVIISQESNVKQVRDDFACMGKTKPIDKSMLVTYNQSDPHISLFKEIYEGTRVFQGRIQPEGSTISKKNDYYLFTANQISTGVADLLYGGTDKVTKNKGIARLKGEENRVKAIKKAIHFYETYAAHSDSWKPLLQDKSITQKTVALSLLRETRLDCKTTGLQILSLIGHQILFEESIQADIEEEDIIYSITDDLRDLAIEMLARKINYDLTNPDTAKFWNDCGVYVNNSVGTQNQVIANGVAAVKKVLVAALREHLAQAEKIPANV